jgi:trans-aconitate methyltransferase
MSSWDAADYHRHSAAQQAWARELLPKLALTGEEYLLDIGCGDGKVTAEIAEWLPRGTAVGVDSSSEMIRFARATFPPERCPRLTFEVMDACRLAYEDEFDVVFSNATLHWIVDHRPVLAGIARALVPGGRALLQMAGRGNASAVVAVLDELIAEADWHPYFEGFTFPYGFHAADEYRKWAEASGLNVKRAELISKDMAQAGPEGLGGWLRTTWLPYLERVPQERRSALVKSVVSRYMERHPPDEQGSLHVDMVRLEVELARLPDGAPRPRPRTHDVDR